jgi:mono/diheme cytochrome c family protein
MAFHFDSKSTGDGLAKAKAFSSKSRIASALLVSLGVLLFKPDFAFALGDASKGSVVFVKNNCSVCHPGGENTMEPGHPIKGKAFSQKYQDDLILENTIRKGFPEYGMPKFSKAQISDLEMKNLIAYVRSLSAVSKNPRN